MAFADLQGGRLDLQVAPPNGVSLDCRYKHDKTTPKSLSGAVVTAYLADDRGGPVQSFPQQITDAEAGEFNLVIPGSAFADKWGEAVSYVVHARYAGASAPTPLLHGVIQVKEAV